MAEVDVRVLTITGTGSVPVSGLGFAPKYIKAIAAHNAGNDAGATGRDTMYCVGFGTYRGGSVQQVYQTYTDDDAAATSIVATGRNNSALLKGLTVPTATTVGTDYEIDLTSLDADGYTLNVVDAPALANFKVMIIAVGGSDITDAYAFNFATTATATQDVTVLAGFGQPDFVELCMAGNGQALGDLAATAYFSLGIAGKTNLNGRCSMMAILDNAGTMDMEARQTATLLNRFNATPAFSWSAVMSATGNWPTDGFELTGSTTMTVEQVIGVAVKCTCAYTITTTTVPRSGTPPVVRTISHSEPPGLAFFWGLNMPANAATIGGDVSSAVFGGYGMGASDGANEAWFGFTQDDGNTASIAGTQHSAVKAWQVYVPAATTATLAAEADCSFSGNDVLLSFNDVDTPGPTVDREVNVFILGAPVTSTPKSDSDTGTGTDTAAASAAIPATADTGTGTDNAVRNAAIPSADTAAGADNATLTATAAATDTNGAVVETGQVEIKEFKTSSDTGAGTDNGSLTTTVTGSDTGSGADTATAVATSVGTDTGAGADTAAATASIPGADTASGTDNATSTAQVANADTGSGLDTGAVDAGNAKSGTDTASANDNATVAVSVASADAASGSENASYTYAFTTTDLAGTPVENASVSAVVASTDAVGPSSDNSSVNAVIVAQDASGPVTESGSSGTDQLKSGDDLCTSADNGVVDAEYILVRVVATVARQESTAEYIQDEEASTIGDARPKATIKRL